MRLKTYTAATTTEALAQVGEELGPDAIIVSTQDLAGGGVRVTAALDRMDLEEEFPDMPGQSLDQILEKLDEVLLDQGLPEALYLGLMDAARLSDGIDARMVMADALEKFFDFKPLPERPNQKPFLFMGPPGAGKTMVVAKLATRAVMARKTPRVLSTDTVRAGGIGQLEAFTRILKLDLVTAGSPDELARAVKPAANEVDFTFIDTANSNPYDLNDMEKLGRLVESSKAEGVLVLPAGLDPMEAADIAQAYGEYGARRLLITRLDAAKRIGGPLAAADSGNLCLCDVSMTPGVTDGLSPLSPVSLARLLLPEASASDAAPSFSEVAL